MKAQGTKVSEARILFYGAGSSAVGVAQSIASYIPLKGKVPEDKAKKARSSWSHYRASVAQDRTSWMRPSAFADGTLLARDLRVGSRREFGRA